MAPRLPAIAATWDVQTGRFIAIDSNQFYAAPLFAIAFTHNCKRGSPLWVELRSQTAVAWKSANGVERTTSSRNGLPLSADRSHGRQDTDRRSARVRSFAPARLTCRVRPVTALRTPLS